MPARIIEELTSRKKEKIATFLTFESIVAVMIAFLPLFMVSSNWPLLLRVPVCAAAAVAGYVMTLEAQGLPLYEHVVWTARGLFRLRIHGDRVSPADLPGATLEPDKDRVIAVGGPIELVQRGGARPVVAISRAPVVPVAQSRAVGAPTAPTASAPADDALVLTR
ncbi:MAG: hypothetical protein HGA45_28605 [Chloroflexales bacterium]|nr:hypothetical protein [Chloroflexales bacterium]